jgi:hypothetical protein
MYALCYQYFALTELKVAYTMEQKPEGCNHYNALMLRKMITVWAKYIGYGKPRRGVILVAQKQTRIPKPRLAARSWPPIAGA